MNQYQIANAIDKIDGYYTPLPNEAPADAFKRAKSDALFYLEKQITHVAAITPEQWLASKAST
jgi:hypothetical protein